MIVGVISVGVMTVGVLSVGVMTLSPQKYPRSWKIAHVIPLFKNGDKSLPLNYRPVSLLSCVSKIFEKIVFKNIFNHLHKNKLLCKFQSGFIPGLSTLD
jgi:hypothetical protein